MACARPGRRPTEHLITSWLLTIIGSTTPCSVLSSRKLFREIDLANQFFDSLKQDYRQFSDWLATKTNDYARVSTDDQTFLIGNHQERASNSAAKSTSNNLETHTHDVIFHDI
jgi:hypothetical protein